MCTNYIFTISKANEWSRSSPIVAKMIEIISKIYSKKKVEKSKQKRDLVGLVTSWVSSNNHSSFAFVSLG